MGDAGALVATHRLPGFEPDNLLAFLALLGLLRALDTARPDWRARAHWDASQEPLRPVLTLREAADRSEVAVAVADGVAALAASHAFGGRADLNHTVAEARAALTMEDAPAILDVLLSDGAARDNGIVTPTLFCFLFGQGHQHFLSRLADVPRGVLPTKLAKGKRRPDLTEPSYLERTLFGPWERCDPTDGFRWDPLEDRRYALAAMNPSDNPAGQEHGANRLAAVGLGALLGAVVLSRRREPRFANLATAPDGASFVWPIWTVAARLQSIVALLAHPAIVAEAPPPGALVALGIAGVLRAQRISVGKFVNVARARWVA